MYLFVSKKCCNKKQINDVTHFFFSPNNETIYKTNIKSVIGIQLWDFCDKKYYNKNNTL